jgi:large subunit ribosomal protein L23
MPRQCRPDFTVTLLRTPHRPPTEATFEVPLSFNKLDMRDYLYHAYNVRVRNIRSAVYQFPIQLYKQKTINGREIPWQVYGSGAYRPPSIKKMFVELEKPFVWPQDPVDLSPWEKEVYDMANDERDMEERQLDDEAEERKAYREQAKQYLSGEKKWKPTWQELEPMGIVSNLRPKDVREEFRKRYR